MIQFTLTQLAKIFSLRRSVFYRELTKPVGDEKLKIKIEAVMADNPTYGHKRIAQELKLNHKRINRVMNRFNLRPVRVRQHPWPDKPEDKGKPATCYPNLIKEVVPVKPNHIWVSDFTYIWFHDRFVYLSTIIDRFTREVLGWNVSLHRNQALTIGALTQALKRSGFSLPEFLHSDQGTPYDALAYLRLAESLGIIISMSHKTSPWENPHQESYYSHFKLDLGDPERFETLGELIEAIYQTISYYNNRRQHTILKMPPVRFKQQYYQRLAASE